MVIFLVTVLHKVILTTVSGQPKKWIQGLLGCGGYCAFHTAKQGISGSRSIIFVGTN